MKTANLTIVKNTTLAFLCFMLLCSAAKKSYAQSTVNITLMDLIDFQAKSKGAYIQLFWSERVPSHDNFIVERAGEDGIFQVIGKVDKESEFLDQHPLDKNNYYRLAGCNANKIVSCSNTIIVEHKIQVEIQLMPNPATEYIDISFFVEPNVEANIAIINQQGNLVFEQKNNDPFGGVQQIKVDLQEYVAGVYLLRIFDGETARIRKFVVL